MATSPPDILGEDVHTSFVSATECGGDVGVSGDIALTVRQTERPSVGTSREVVGVGHGNGIAAIDVTAAAHVVIGFQLLIACLCDIFLNEDFVQRVGRKAWC